MTLGARANVKVRAERGGDEAARARTDALKTAWPRDVVKHCDSLLAGPMPPTTYEALLAVCGWRASQDAMRRDAPYVRHRTDMRVRAKALRRLKAMHPDEYRTLYQEERRNEAASTKENRGDKVR